ncbi:MAG: DUF2949 domain-containing protein [Cyanobacteria bacterium P01_D01_bin.56]
MHHVYKVVENVKNIMAIPDLSMHLFQFLQVEHDIPADKLRAALDDCGQLPTLTPIALWQSGTVTLEQLDTIFDWIELNYPRNYALTQNRTVAAISTT